MGSADNIKSLLRASLLWAVVQFLGISLVVGKEAVGHIRAREGPEEGGMLLMLAAASVVVLSALCGLKLDLSVNAYPVTRHSIGDTHQITPGASSADLQRTFLQHMI